MTEKKDRIKAWATTITVHAVLLILLAFLTISAAQPSDNDDGVPVILEEEEEPLRLAADLGNTDEAMAEADQGTGGSNKDNAADETVIPEPVAPAESPKPQPATKPDPKPAKPVIVQKDEQTIAAEQAAKRAKEEREAAARKKAEAEIAAREAAEKARREEEARKAEEARKTEEARRAAASKVAGAFGGGNGVSSGNGSSTTGTGSGASGKGNGAGGVGGEAKVGNRTVKSLPKPNYADASSEGTIVVAITVSPAGDVTSATIKSNNTNSVPLRNAAIAAAKQARFSEGSATENGTITYRFKQK